MRPWLLLALLPPLALPIWADTNVPPDGKRLRDIQALFEDRGARLAGSPGSQRIEEKVAARFAASGFAHGELPFDVPAFTPGETRLTAGGTTYRLHPMHPCVMRPGNFPERHFTSTVVDLHRATESDVEAVKGIPLRDALVLMDYTSGANWQRLLRFGVKGFVFVGAEANPPVEGQLKCFTTEANVPRFYIEPLAGAALRRAIADTPAGRREVSVEAEPSRWDGRTVRDLWVLVPGSDPQLGREIVLIAAALDANGAVPGLAVGGQSAANLHLLLDLLDHFKHQRPARSVLLAALNGHCQRYAGERVLTWNLLMPSATIEEMRAPVAEEARYQDLLARTYERLGADLADPARGQAAIDALIDANDVSLGRRIPLRTPLVSALRRGLIASQSALASAGASERTPLEATRSEWEHMLGLCREVGGRMPLDQLTPGERARLLGAVGDIASENRRLMDLNCREIRLSEACRDVLRATANGSVVLAINLELTWTRPEIGFGTGNYWGDQQWPIRFGRNSQRVAAALAAAGKGGGTNLLQDTLTNIGGLAQGFFFSANSQSAVPFQLARLPAFVLSTPFVAGGRAFSPDDTIERLDPIVLERTSRFTREFLGALLADAHLTVPQELPPPGGGPPLWSCRVRAFESDAFSPDVLPNVPVPGTLVTLQDWGTPFLGPDVVGAWTAITDARAAVTVPGLAKSTSSPIFTQAYRLDADSVTIDRVIDSGEAHNRVSSNLTPSRDLILPMFRCQEYLVRERADASLVGNASIGNQRYLVLDARYNTAPRRYGMVGAGSVLSSKRWPGSEVNGPVAVCVDPGASFKLIADPGGCTMINGSQEDPEGTGFGPGRPLPDDVFAAAARDMGFLNASRLSKLHGVSDELATRFVAEGQASQRASEARLAANDHLGYLQALHAALGAEVKAYRQITTTRNDLLKAIVLYMALLLPFCLFLQKLLFKTVRVEAQLGIFIVLFVCMYALFRNIHPAFAVARAPEAMFVAFAMGALGLFVIWVLHGRFQGEMQLLFRAFEGSEAASVGASQAGQQALMIGVNNMKRRRIRTTLTTATIVLVTFTMLAFTSVSKQMRPTMVVKSNASPYTGIYYHWPGKTMDEATLQVMRELYHARGQVLVRRWMLAPSQDTGEQRHVIPLRLRAPDGGPAVNIEAALGLAAAEDGFIEKIPLLPGGRFFSADDAAEVVLPESVATALAIDPGQLARAIVETAGRRLKVVGIVRDEHLRALHDLDQTPLLPVKSMRKRPAEAPDELAIEEENESGVTRFEPSMLIVLPVDTCRQFNGRPYSVSVRLRDDEPVWPAARMLLTATQARFHIGSRSPFDVADTAGKGAAHAPQPVEAGVYYVGTGYRTAIGGLMRLIIPLLIAATIVLNTMLGAVFERRREIAVYNAVGLNPTHIGLFFLAEAFVYSVIGAVGGYLIGQLLGLALKHSNLVSGVNLNFSSLSVVYVILFTIGIVLLSTLYPAIVATRAAVPSGKRKWSVPAHDGNVMHIVFPTIYKLDALPGVMAYLEAYFSRFAEAALADVIAKRVGRETSQDSADRPVYEIRYELALAPYDLGVTQNLTLRGAWDEALGFARVTLTIERTSGQDTNWAAVNRRFLDKLRHYLLNWRNLDAATRERFSTAAI